jgi:hypothetical protein
MERVKIASELVKLAKDLTAREEVIATNVSSWSWEDDAVAITARVYLNDRNGALRLEMEKVHEKYGLGKGIRKTILEDISLGTVFKPKLGPVAGLLKRHGHSRTRAGGPFSRKWRGVDAPDGSLRSIIDYHREQMGDLAGTGGMPPELARLEPKFDKATATILKGLKEYQAVMQALSRHEDAGARNIGAQGVLTAIRDAERWNIIRGSDWGLLKQNYED